jgi:hypothetical protein
MENCCVDLAIKPDVWISRIRSPAYIHSECIKLCLTTHKKKHKIIKRGENIMRTTLDLPESLIENAMSITHAKTKTELIKLALENIINQEKRKNIRKYHGKIDLEIDIDKLRKR